ncbi:MAG: PLP-dependent aminotransferase family protein [Opitutales bacterium]
MTLAKTTTPGYSSLGERLSSPVITRLMSTALARPDLLSLAAGFTDTSTLPRQAVHDAVGRVLSAAGGPAEALQYGTNQGRPLLRALLSGRLAELDGNQEGCPVEDDSSFFITNGSQQGLSLALQTLCDPGDIVLVEEPTYFVFLELARGLGIDVRSLPADSNGRVDGERFDRQLADLDEGGLLSRVKAVYLVSYFSNPSSRSLTEHEKEGIGEVLSARDIYPAIIEDAAYRELFFNEPEPSRSVLRLPAFQGFPLLYTGTCTKPFATGLKVGYAVCPHEEWRSKMLHLKGHQDFGTANFSQAIVEEALRSGAYDSHLRRIRGDYREKMETLHGTLLDAGLAALGWEWKRPDGGLYLWVRAPEAVDTGIDSSFCSRALDEGVFYVPGELCFSEGAPRNFLRLSFGSLREDRLTEAAMRFVRAAAAQPA